MHPDWEAEFHNYTDGMADVILDRESEFKQFFDDLCDGQRDSYLDELESQ
jgi:hypothetical protein